MPELEGYFHIGGNRRFNHLYARDNEISSSEYITGIGTFPQVVFALNYSLNSALRVHLSDSSELMDDGIVDSSALEIDFRGECERTR